MSASDDLPLLAFESVEEWESWLCEHHEGLLAFG